MPDKKPERVILPKDITKEEAKKLLWEWVQQKQKEAAQSQEKPEGQAGEKDDEHQERSDQA